MPSVWDLNKVRMKLDLCYEGSLLALIILLLQSAASYLLCIVLRTQYFLMEAAPKAKLDIGFSVLHTTHRKCSWPGLSRITLRNCDQDL